MFILHGEELIIMDDDGADPEIQPTLRTAEGEIHYSPTLAEEKIMGISPPPISPRKASVPR